MFICANKLLRDKKPPEQMVYQIAQCAFCPVLQTCLHTF